MARVRVKVTRIKSVTERCRFARSLAREIIANLEAGWNPFVEQESARGFHRF